MNSARRSSTAPKRGNRGFKSPSVTETISAIISALSAGKKPVAPDTPAAPKETKSPGLVSELIDELRTARNGGQQKKSLSSEKIATQLRGRSAAIPYAQNDTLDSMLNTLKLISIDVHSVAQAMGATYKTTPTGKMLRPSAGNLEQEKGFASSREIEEQRKLYSMRRALLGDLTDPTSPSAKSSRLSQADTSDKSSVSIQKKILKETKQTNAILQKIYLRGEKNASLAERDKDEKREKDYEKRRPTKLGTGVSSFLKGGGEGDKAVGGIFDGISSLLGWIGEGAAVKKGLEILGGLIKGAKQLGGAALGRLGTVLPKLGSLLGLGAGTAAAGAGAAGTAELGAGAAAAGVGAAAGAAGAGTGAAKKVGKKALAKSAAKLVGKGLLKLLPGVGLALSAYEFYDMLTHPEESDLLKLLGLDGTGKKKDEESSQIFGEKLPSQTSPFEQQKDIRSTSDTIPSNPEKPKKGHFQNINGSMVEVSSEGQFSQDQLEGLADNFRERTLSYGDTDQKALENITKGMSPKRAEQVTEHLKKQGMSVSTPASSSTAVPKSQIFGEKLPSPTAPFQQRKDMRATDPADMPERMKNFWGIPKIATPENSNLDYNIKMAHTTPSAIKTHSTKLADYDKFITAASEKYKVPKELIQGVIDQESAGNKDAVSRVGAQGLMQLMPDTAKDLGLAKEDAFDPEKNIDAGAKYLGKLLKQSKGNVEEALIAYNAGPGSLAKIKAGKKELPEESAQYVPNVLARTARYQFMNEQTALKENAKRLGVTPDKLAEMQATAQVAGGGTVPKEQPKPTTLTQQTDNVKAIKELGTPSGGRTGEQKRFDRQVEKSQEEAVQREAELSATTTPSPVSTPETDPRRQSDLWLKQFGPTLPNKPVTVDVSQHAIPVPPVMKGFYNTPISPVTLPSPTGEVNPWSPATSTSPTGAVNPWSPSTSTSPTGAVNPWSPSAVPSPTGATSPWSPATSTSPRGATSPWSPAAVPSPTTMPDSPETAVTHSRVTKTIRTYGNEEWEPGQELSSRQLMALKMSKATGNYNNLPEDVRAQFEKQTTTSPTATGQVNPWTPTSPTPVSPVQQEPGVADRIGQTGKVLSGVAGAVSPVVSMMGMTGKTSPQTMQKLGMATQGAQVLGQMGTVVGQTMGGPFTVPMTPGIPGAVTTQGPGIADRIGQAGQVLSGVAGAATPMIAMSGMMGGHKSPDTMRKIMMATQGAQVLGQMGTVVGQTMGGPSTVPMTPGIPGAIPQQEPGVADRIGQAGRVVSGVAGAMSPVISMAGMTGKTSPQTMQKLGMATQGAQVLGQVASQIPALANVFGFGSTPKSVPPTPGTPGVGPSTPSVVSDEGTVPPPTTRKEREARDAEDIQIAKKKEDDEYQTMREAREQEQKEYEEATQKKREEIEKFERKKKKTTPSIESPSPTEVSAPMASPETQRTSPSSTTSAEDTFDEMDMSKEELLDKYQKAGWKVRELGTGQLEMIRGNERMTVTPAGGALKSAPPPALQGTPSKSTGSGQLGSYLDSSSRELSGTQKEASAPTIIPINTGQQGAAKPDKNLGYKPAPRDQESTYASRNSANYLAMP